MQALSQLSYSPKKMTANSSLNRLSSQQESKKNGGTFVPPFLAY